MKMEIRPILSFCLLLGITMSAGAEVREEALHLARDGGTDYVIVLPEDAIPAERTAAEQLQKYLQRITGATFPIQNEQNVQAGTARILVGAGAGAKSLLPGEDWEALGTDGIVIKSVGDQLILAGGRPRGSLYAVFEFLEQTVGCRWWTPTEARIPEHPTLTIPPQNITYVSPFHHMRQHNGTLVVENPEFATILREFGPYVEQSEQWGGRYSQLRCAFSDLLPPEKYFKDHPEWYTDALNGDLPCTAASQMPRTRLDWQVDLSNPEVVETFAAEAIKRIETHPDATSLAVWANDNPHYCRCDQCGEVIEREGSASGIMLQFVNAVAERVHERFPDLPVEMQAYWWSVQPPKSMRAGKNVLIDLALIGADFGHPVDSQWNQESRDLLQGWARVAPQLHIWYYVTNFRWSMFPHPNWNSLGADLRFFSENNVTGIFEQGNTHSGGAGDFIQLRTWLLSKLMWNPSHDQEELTREFLEGYYGAAAPHLKAYLDLVQSSFLAKEQLLGTYNPDFTYFTLEVTNQALRLFERAAEAVKDDATMASRVRRERLSLDIVVLAKFRYLHREAERTGTPFIGPDDLDEAFATFEKTAKQYGVTDFREDKTTIEQGLAEMRSRLKLRPTHPLPDFARAYAPEDIVDYLPGDIHLYGRGTLTDLVEDPAAPDGTACMSVGNIGEQSLQVRIGPYLSSHRWHVYALVRADVTPGTELEGPAFVGGIKDLNRRNMDHEQEIPMKEAAGETYHLVDLGTHELHGGKEVRFAPLNKPSVTKIYVGRVILIREEARRIAAE